jgi:hypothetical protein
MATATTPTPGAVTLSVEFAGLCLYVIDDSSGTRTVSVLMPTCVPTDWVDANGVSTRVVDTMHADGDRGARHVPYLLIDPANLPLRDDQNVAAPRFQVVRRLSREEIVINLESQGPVKLDPDPLPLPNLNVYNGSMRLRNDYSSAFTRLAGNDRPELSVRTILRGGTLRATTIDGSGKVVARSATTLGAQTNVNWEPGPADWAGWVEWTGTVPEPFAIEILDWVTGQRRPLTLRPAVDGNRVIRLKIANLCETNPLEWREFDHVVQTDDVDFKWLFRLFTIRDSHPNPRQLPQEARLPDAIGRPDANGRPKFPYPRLTPRTPRTTGSTGCTGGQFGP